LSHLPERKKKDCLNCGRVVKGRYCHRCGQENVETKQSVWQFLVHFFNDITHFDGKFFQTLKLLVTKPGFVTAEFFQGRRLRYLDPARMYIFTSAVFFLIYFNITSPFFKVDLPKKPKSELMMIEQLEGMNEQQFRSYISALVLTDTAFSKQGLLPDYRKHEEIQKRTTYLINEAEDNEFMAMVRHKNHRWLLNSIRRWKIPSDSLAEIPDTSFRRFLVSRLMQDPEVSRANLKRHLQGQTGITIGKVKYRTKAEYDSLVNAGKTDHNWFQRVIFRRVLELNEKYRSDGTTMMRTVATSFNQFLPQMLFVSLPMLAVILKLLYWRRKQFYYVDHTIFLLHLYIFVFITMLLNIGLGSIQRSAGWSFINFIQVGIVIWNLIYTYLGMKRYYQQGHLKTFSKFVLLLITALVIMLFLFLAFLLLSLFKV
jgi:hypothetical protein